MKYDYRDAAGAAATEAPRGMLYHRYEVDAQGLPAYLESSSPANVPLYRRHGFEVVEVLKATPDAPEMWAMWREARAPE